MSHTFLIFHLHSILFLQIHFQSLLFILHSLHIILQIPKSNFCLQNKNESEIGNSSHTFILFTLFSLYILCWVCPIDKIGIDMFETKSWSGFLFGFLFGFLSGILALECFRMFCRKHKDPRHSSKDENVIQKYLWNTSWSSLTFSVSGNWVISCNNKVINSDRDDKE